MVLLHGGGLTSAAWYATVGPLIEAGTRIYAVDIICDRGRSVPGEEPVATRADLVVWLTETMRGLGLGRADLAGHSYGGWIAAHHAVHAPDTVDRLLLLDASTVFTSFRPSYLLRAASLLVGDRSKAMRRLLTWETGGRATGLWADLMCAKDDAKAPKLVLPKRLTGAELQRLPEKTFVLVAGKARAHDAAKNAATARRSGCTTVVVPGATHHTVPAEDAEAVNATILALLGM
jgi:pimeloyl-ACP methyl ester carboxylesterase